MLVRTVWVPRLPFVCGCAAKIKGEGRQDDKPPCPVSDCKALRKSIMKLTPSCEPLPRLATQQAQAAPEGGWPKQKDGAQKYRCNDHGDFIAVRPVKLQK